MDEWRQGFGQRNPATEFFSNFSNNGLCGILARFDLASGKFPFQGQELVCGTPGNEDETVPDDDGADDRNGRSIFHALQSTWKPTDDKALTNCCNFIGVSGVFVSSMKTFLKIILIAVLLIVAIKLSPMIFLGALLGLIAAAALGTVGITLVAVLLVVLVALMVALSPIWLPMVVIIGFVSLFKKTGQQAPSSVIAT